MIKMKKQLCGVQISANNEKEAIKKIKENFEDAEDITARFMFIYGEKKRYDMRFKSNTKM